MQNVKNQDLKNRKQWLKKSADKDGHRVHHSIRSNKRGGSGRARGLDGLWGMYQWLDRAPRGRNETHETGIWFRRQDEHDSQ